MLLLDRKK